MNVTFVAQHPQNTYPANTAKNAVKARNQPHLGLSRILLDASKRDQGEHHRKDRNRLYDAQSGEVVGEALVRLGL